MTDYLITRYNDKITASRAAMETAIADATKLYNTACADIIAKWQSNAIEAAMDLEIAMGARDRHYLNGPAETPQPETSSKITIPIIGTGYILPTPGVIKVFPIREEYRTEVKEALGHPHAPGVDVCNVGSAE